MIAKHINFQEINGQIRSADVDLHTARKSQEHT